MKSILPASRKKAIGEEILEKKDLHPKVQRLLLLLIENDRLEFLPDISDHLPDMWNVSQGISSFEISSVVSGEDGEETGVFKI